jgi:hypothetical protein
MADPLRFRNSIIAQASLDTRNQNANNMGTYHGIIQTPVKPQ